MPNLVRQHKLAMGRDLPRKSACSRSVSGRRNCRCRGAGPPESGTLIIAAVAIELLNSRGERGESVALDIGARRRQIGPQSVPHVVRAAGASGALE